MNTSIEFKYIIIITVSKYEMTSYLWVRKAQSHNQNNEHRLSCTFHIAKWHHNGFLCSEKNETKRCCRLLMIWLISWHSC